MLENFLKQREGCRDIQITSIKCDKFFRENVEITVLELLEFVYETRHD